MQRLHNLSLRALHTKKMKDAVESSRIAGQLWSQLTAQRGPYHAKANEAKRRHAIVHPNYKYTRLLQRLRHQARGTARPPRPDPSVPAAWKR